MGAATHRVARAAHRGGWRGPLGPRDRVVLTALATHPGDVVDAERLADALWGERPPASWNKVVPGCVMRLRRALGAGGDRDHAARLPAGDARRRHRCPAFRATGRAGPRAVDAGRAGAGGLRAGRGAGVVARPATGGRRGLGAGADRGGPTRGAAPRRRGGSASTPACRAGSTARCWPRRRSLVPQAPLRERRWALLALAQYQAGRQGEALRTLRQARRCWRPSWASIRDPSWSSWSRRSCARTRRSSPQAALTRPSAACPYRGLLPFDVGDADGFFGRDAEVAECLRRLTATDFAGGGRRLGFAASPRSCAPASRLRCSVTAAGSRS